MENPVPDKIDVLSSVLLLVGVPAAVILPFLVILGIADWIRFGASTIEVSRAVAARVSDRGRWLDGQSWGRLVTLGLAQVGAIVSVYVAVRWIMGLPRVVWPGLQLTWPERALYAISPPVSLQEPESTAALVALGITLTASAAAVLGMALVESIAAALMAVVRLVCGLIGAVTTVVGLIGIAFFSAAIGSAGSSLRTPEIQAAKIAEATGAREGAVEIVLLGLVILVSCGALFWYETRLEVANSARSQIKSDNDD